MHFFPKNLPFVKSKLIIAWIRTKIRFTMGENCGCKSETEGKPIELDSRREDEDGGGDGCCGGAESEVNTVSEYNRKPNTRIHRHSHVM